MPIDREPAVAAETKTITEALELCVKLEKDEIQRCEWLVKNDGDRESALIINRILL